MDRGHGVRTGSEIGQVFIVLGQRRKEIIDRLSLQFDGGQLIHSVTEGRRADQPFRVPGNMLAGDAYSRLGSVKKIQVLKVSKQDLVNFTDARRQQMGAGVQKMFNFAE